MVSTVAVIVASGLILNVNVVSGLLVKGPDEVLATVLLGPSDMGGAGYYLAKGIIFESLSESLLPCILCCQGHSAHLWQH